MANILLVDTNEVARKAMHGILARGGHRLACAAGATDALEVIRRNVRVDLIFTELKIAGDGGLAFVRRLKADRLLRLLPVVIYTEHADRDAVKRALELRVQNFLIKPYHDEDIFAEIEKAEVNPWRARHFEEEKSFCRMMGLTPAEMHRMLDDVRTALLAARPALERDAALQDHPLVASTALPLREQAEAAGAWGVVECLNQMVEHSSAGAWSGLPTDLAQLDFAADLVAHWIDPQRDCPDFTAGSDSGPSALERERAIWLAAPGAGRCPVVTPEQLRAEVIALPGCPVIESAAASFQMMANGHPSCINPLMDIVARDPGLSTLMLIAANRAHPSSDDFNRIEDARLAVGQLGEIRLQEEARRLTLIDARTFSLEPALGWTSYWLFQRAVARIAQLICRELEFNSLEAPARTIGQMHDLGLLLLARLRPAGCQAILEHARLNRLPRRETEKLFLGCTTPELATIFAEHFGLSRRFTNVLRWWSNPATATEDRQLVAIVSLSRALCRQNEVGTSGDPLLESSVPLEETAEWAILREGLYPSFNLRKFEAKVHAACGQLRTELSGHQSGTVGELVASAANN